MLAAQVVIRKELLRRKGRERVFLATPFQEVQAKPELLSISAIQA